MLSTFVSDRVFHFATVQHKFVMYDGQYIPMHEGESTEDLPESAKNFSIKCSWWNLRHIDIDISGFELVQILNSNSLDFVQLKNVESPFQSIHILEFSPSNSPNLA